MEKGLIRIGTVTSVASHWLPSVIKRFREDYPNIDYEITTRGYSEVERMIAEGQVDCGFVRLPTRPNFDLIYLERDELKVVLSPNHPLADVDRFPIRALGDYPFMTISRTGSLRERQAERKRDIRMRIVSVLLAIGNLFGKKAWLSSAAAQSRFCFERGRAAHFE